MNTRDLLCGRGSHGVVSLLLAILVLGLVSTVSAQWTSGGRLKVPQYSYSFLAASPRGDLLAATFNINPESGKLRPVSLPALLIRNPSAPTPEVVELCRTEFDSQRGYSGIASDPSGSFYVSGDTGDPGTSFIRRFKPDGTPDTTFGQSGQVLPGKRCLGVDVFSDYLMAAVDWGVVQVYDAKSGAYINSLPSAPGTVYVRDIAIDPKSMRVFGVATGGIVTWGKGAPWNAVNYQYRVISPATTRPRAGEGLSIDPLRRTIVITPIPGNTLKEIYGNGRVVESTIASAKPDAHLADTVLSFDGTTLYVSDMHERAIHVMKRQLLDGERPSATPVSYAPPSSKASVPAPKWNRSYEDIAESARRQKQPILVYFRAGSLPLCGEFERNVLLTDEFNSRAGKFACVFEDVEVNRLMAYRFGVYRLPYICVMDRQGEVVAEFKHDIKMGDLARAMDSVQ